MKKFLMTLSLVLVALAVTACGCEKKPEPTPVDPNETDKPIANTNEDVIKDQEVKGLKFTNASFVFENNEIIFTTQVENKTTETVELGIFCLVVKDKDDNELYRYANYVGDTMEPGVSRTLYTNAEADINTFNKIVKVEYVIEKDCMNAK